MNDAPVSASRWPCRCWLVACAADGAADPRPARKPARRPGAEDAEQPLLHRHAAGRRRRRREGSSVDLVVQAAEREVDVEKQMQIIENLIQTGVKALAITPSGSQRDRAGHRQGQRGRDPRGDRRHPGRWPAAAEEAGIKIAHASSARTTTRAAGSPGSTSSQITGGKAKVAVLEGIPGHETGDSRLRGFKERGRRLVPASRSSPPSPRTGSATSGFNVFQNMLQAHPEIDAVFACNDMMALGAIEAIAAAGKTGKIKVIGFDAVDDARKAIDAGTMVGSVAQFPAEMGRRGGGERRSKLLKGEAVPADQQVRSSSSRQPAAAAK